MAHSCPICDMHCHCNGDIDDIQLDGGEDQDNCIHCLDVGDEDEDDYYPEDDDEISDEEKEDNRLAYEAEIKNYPKREEGDEPQTDGTFEPDNERDNLPF